MTLLYFIVSETEKWHYFILTPNCDILWTLILYCSFCLQTYSFEHHGPCEIMWLSDCLFMLEQNIWRFNITNIFQECCIVSTASMYLQCV